MRALHREKLSRLFGNSARLSRSGFLNGLAAVLITSLLTELGFWLIIPDVAARPDRARHLGALSAADPLLRLRPDLVGGALFRGYLQRGLAYRFRSPLVWAVLPTLVFTALHWNPASVLGMNIGVLISIGAFAALLALLVYATGNLGAAMGAHLGNNLVGFLLISHDDTLGGLALFRAPPLDGLAWTPAETADDRRHQHRLDPAHLAAAAAPALAAQGRARPRPSAGRAGGNSAGSRAKPD